MIVTESFAFWYEKNETANDNVTAVMHFNLWTQCGWKGKKRSEEYLDIGFILSHIDCASKLYFYIPFAVKSEEFIDLGKKLNNNELLDAVFNENYSYSTIPDTDHCLVKAADGSVVFDLCYLEKGVNVSIANEFEGTLLSFDVKNILDYKDADKSRDFYFRFRIKSHDFPNLIRKYKPKDSFLQSTIATTYIIDFRFNNKRNLGRQILNAAQSQKNDFIEFTKFHFFLMTKANIDVDGSSHPRELEKDIWKSYVDDHDTTDIVAYHNSKKNESEEKKTFLSWEYFTKVKVNQSTWLILIVYLGILLIMTLLLNILSSAICTFVFHWGS